MLKPLRLGKAFQTNIPHNLASRMLGKDVHDDSGDVGNDDTDNLTVENHGTEMLHRSGSNKEFALRDGHRLRKDTKESEGF